MDNLGFYFDGNPKLVLKKSELKNPDIQWTTCDISSDEGKRPYCVMAVFAPDAWLYLFESDGYCEEDVAIIEEQCNAIAEAKTIEEVKEIVDNSKYIYLK